MPTDADALLTLSQWLSPSFPVSAFAYSGGLETAVAQGHVHAPATTAQWADAMLRGGAGRCDAILLCLTLRGEGSDARLADLAQALAGSAERWRETRDQGRAFADTLAAMGAGDVPGYPFPVALGVAARPLGLPPALVARLFLQAMVGNLVSAAIRLVPIGQAAGQGVIAALAPQVAATAEMAVAAGPEALWSSVPGAELATMAHETQEVRLFRS